MYSSFECCAHLPSIGNYCHLTAHMSEDVFQKRMSGHKWSSSQVSYTTTLHAPCARYARVFSALGPLGRVADSAPPDAVLTFAPCLGMLLLLGSLQQSTKQLLGVNVTMLHRVEASMHDVEKLLQLLIDVPCAIHLHSICRECESSLSRQTAHR